MHMHTITGLTQMQGIWVVNIQTMGRQRAP